VNNPKIIISLDFELHWGRFDKYPLETNLAYYHNTREVIPRLLELFWKNEIHATWATVGMLMAEDREELAFYSPELIPSYKNSRFSAYSWLETQDKIYKEALFAPDLVRKILETPNQELGSHSFAHYYTMEEGQTSEQWRADLRATNRLAKEKFGCTLSSLVFPRNQYSTEKLIIAQNEGYGAVRTNPKDWFWGDVQNESLIKKIFRTGDTLLPLGQRASYHPEINSDRIVELPASRLLRPYCSGSMFNGRRIDRIKGELNQAIDFGEAYHLWWHPHNFGTYPKENLKILEGLLQWVRNKMETSGLLSTNMGEAAKIYKKEILQKSS